jgi:hypothetical protein
MIAAKRLHEATLEMFRREAASLADLKRLRCSRVAFVVRRD